MDILNEILHIFTPYIAEATEYVPLIGEAPELGIETGAGSNLSEFLTKMFAVLISITGILGVIMLVIGGIQYMTTDAVFGKSLGKQRIVSAGGGIILALSAWIILKTINPDLLENELDVNIDAEVEKDPGSFGLTYFQLTQTPSTESGGNTVPTYSSGGRIVGVNSTSGNINTSWFGGPKDVRITPEGYALQYCNNTYGGRVGSQYETTQVGGTTYRWCYALNDSGNRISFPQGSTSAHGGYFETASVSGQAFSEMGGLYVAYPLSGQTFSELPNASNTGSANRNLRNHVVQLTLSNGQKVNVAIADRGPHGAISNTLDVSPELSHIINNAGGLDSAALLNRTGQPVTSPIQ